MTVKSPCCFLTKNLFEPIIVILVLNKNLFKPLKTYFNLQNSLFWFPVGVGILIFNKHFQTKVFVLAKLFKCVLKNLAVQQLSRKTFTCSKLTIKILKQRKKNIKGNSFTFPSVFMVFLMLSVKYNFSLSMTTYVNTTVIKATAANLKNDYS